MSDRIFYYAGMNLNREQFLKAVERGQALLTELKKEYPELKLSPVFSRFGPRSGQCDMTTNLRKIVVEFSDMLAGESFNHGCTRKTRMESEGWNATSGRVQSVLGEPAPPEKLRSLLKAIKQAEKEGEKETASNLWKEAEAVEKALLDPEQKLYCGDVLIEYRPGELKYELLRRLQRDSRIPSALNEVGSIRIVAGSLALLGASRGTFDA